MKKFPEVQENPSQDLQGRESFPRDPLTRLPNRLFFENRVAQSIRAFRLREQPFAVVSLDMDGVDEIRETQGDLVADQALKVLADAMKLSLRRGDLLARLCGERFAAVILNVAAPQEILPAIHRLMQAATEPVWVAEHSLQFSVSIGVAFYPQEQEVDAEDLLALAERAMRHAQSTGRNLYHFSDAARVETAVEKDRRIDRIRQALEEEEFVLLYQPKVHLSRGEVYGAEALIRWRHPERGLLAPSGFLPMIEEHHLEIDLGEWVIDTALRQMERWQQAGLMLSVSVNIRPYHLLQPDFPRRLGNLLAKYPAEVGSRLELEIYGSGPGDPEPLAAVVRTCRKMGLTIALDDFGTFHSTLADLKRIPVQEVKIDPLFIRDLMDSPDDVAIFESILGMVEALGRQCMAVGVESVELGSQLLLLGCEKAQGYGIALPMDAASIPDWIAGWSPNPAWLEASTVGLEERLLVYTNVEHKAWITGLEAYLKGSRDAEPRLSRHHCQLGHFIDAEEQAGRNFYPAFQSLAALHWRIHAMGTGIVKLHHQGKSEEGLARLTELQIFFDKLLEELRAFRMKI